MPQSLAGKVIGQTAEEGKESRSRETSHCRSSR